MHVVPTFWHDEAVFRLDWLEANAAVDALHIYIALLLVENVTYRIASIPSCVSFSMPPGNS